MITVLMFVAGLALSMFAIDLRNRGKSNGPGKQIPDHVRMWWYIRRELLGEVDAVDGEIREARLKLGTPLKGSAVQTISFMSTMLYNVTSHPDAKGYEGIVGWLKKMGLDVHAGTDGQDVNRIRQACTGLQEEMRTIIDGLIPEEK